VDCVTDAGQQVTYHARALVLADGAPSALAKKLGLVTTEPQGVCSRAYIKGNTLFKWDGVVFYPPKLLPGYCAIIREANDELNFACYIIPGGPTMNEDLHAMHHEILEKYPYVAKVLGPNPDIERMKAASLRLGGIPKSYANHLLIIGDAAGFIDPLTGEGIQYAMDSGKFASDVLVEGLAKKNLSEAILVKYHDKWFGEWGWEFKWSMRMAKLMYRFPIMLDAAAKLIGKRGSRFLAEWAEVMTGSASKTWFLRLDVWPFLLLETFAQLGRNITGKGKVVGPA
jgi:flavin-dependent dehydrogenase